MFEPLLLTFALSSKISVLAHMFLWRQKKITLDRGQSTIDERGPKIAINRIAICRRCENITMFLFACWVIFILLLSSSDLFSNLTFSKKKLEML